MATPVSSAQLLSHVERSAYLQALAAAIAVKVVRAQSVAEYENDDDAVDVLLAALLIALRRDLVAQVEAAALAQARTLGYAPLAAADVSTTINAQLSSTLERAAPALDGAVQELRNRLRLLAESGMGDAELATVMNTEAMTKALTQRVEGVMKSAATSLVKSIEAETLAMAQRARDGEATAQGQSIAWEWVTMLDDHVCEDHFLNSCQPRHGQSMTLDLWTKNGMPQGPQLICSVYSKSGISQCRCLLVEAGTFAGTALGPVNTADAVRAGRSRAAMRTRKVA